MLLDQPIRRKYTALYVALVLMFVLLAGQLYHLQIIDADKYKIAAEQNTARVMPIKPTRGIVYDRNGQRLVVNDPSWSLAVTPAEVANFDCVSTDLSKTTLFKDLASLLRNPPASSIPVQPITVTNIIAIKPAEVPRTGQAAAGQDQAAIANIMSVLLQTNADNIRGPLADTLKNYPDSTNLFPIRKDVPDAAAQALKAKKLPGVYVYNELEYNFVKGFDKCYKPVVVLRGVNYDMMQLVDARSVGLPGVSVSYEPVRQYTDGPLFSHLLGYVTAIPGDVFDAAKAKYGDSNPYQPDDKIGQSGLEATFDAQLRGQPGQQAVIVDSHERVVSDVSYTPPITGNNLTLTIDSNLQKQVTSALANGLTKANVKSGVAIVMNVNTGQVLSMVSLPSYDNNLFANGISQKDFDTLNNDPTLPMFNRAVSGVYPPGSTYKMITASAALQEGVVTPSQTYFCPGYISVPYTNNENQRTPYRDWKADGQGTINVVQALTVSSDVFFYIAAGPEQVDKVLHLDDGTDRVTYTRYYVPGAKDPLPFKGLGIDRLDKYASAFGFGQKTGVDLPGESTGLVPTRDWKTSIDPTNAWSLGDTLVSAIGQGFDLVTPLQLVNATAAVANGGTLYKPQLVQKITDSNGNTVQDMAPQVLGKVPVSPENLALVREGMRQVVVNKAKGTAASHITLHSFDWAGKTGTAEFGDPIAIKNGKEVRRAHAWFTAFAPFDKPEIAVVVLLEGGQESLEGSTFAVPITDEIMKAYFHKDK